MKNNDILLWSWIILFVLIFIGSIISHEEAHRQISIYHGCINGSITYFSKNINPFWHCYEYSYQSTETNMQEWELHSFNEIVSYNLDAILVMLFSIGGLFILKRNDE